MGFFEALFSIAFASTVASSMAPRPTNNIAAYDSRAADARRKAEQRELKNKRNRAGQMQTVGAGLNGVTDILG